MNSKAVFEPKIISITSPAMASKLGNEIGRGSQQLFKASLRSSKRSFHTTRCRNTYSNASVANLLIDENTPIIYQGFTGRAATANAQDTIAYGTNVVGGVSPGKGGNIHLDRPVFNSVREAMKEVRPHATAVFVPALAAGKAIEEAIEAEVPLIVSVAEHIPVHDIMRVHSMLRTQSKSRLVGPNCPGIIAPGKCRIGIMPYKQFSKGKIGIVSKSGTLSYEAVGATTKTGLGQSIVVGMGGDLLPGTTLKDGLELFYDHDDTEGIIVIGEIGGTAEFDAADSIKEYLARTSNPKPIVAMVSGRTAPKGKVMGHAGALLSPGDHSAEAKAQALKAAGAHVVVHPGMLGEEMTRLIAERTDNS